MGAFTYLLKRNCINYIKSFKHKPSRALPFLFYGFFLVIMVISFSMASKEPNYSNPKYFIGVSTISLIIIFLLIIYNGIMRKNFRYNMSDVNLIFTAPIKSQNVLLYGFIREISYVFAFSLFILFQIPNLALNFKFVKYGLVAFVFCLLLFFITLSFISLLMYGIFSRFNNLKKGAERIVKVLAILIVGGFTLYIYTKSNGDYFNFSIGLFNKEFWNVIPIVGWIRSIIIQCFNGFNYSFILYVVAFILSCILCGFILYKLNIDFYEDALPSAEQNEVAQSFKNSGYDQNKLQNINVKKRKPLFAIRKVEYNYSGKYAKAIFFRHLLECRKSGFGFIDLFSLIYLLISLFIGYKGIPIEGLLGIGIYLMFLTIYAGKWSMDFNSHFIFLIPARSEEKLFYSTLISIIKYGVNALILFLPCSILIKANPITVILCMVSYISFGAVATYGAVLNYRLFDRVSNSMMKGIFMMITLFIYILPGVIGGIILSLFFKVFGEYSLYISFILYNALASLVIIHFAKTVYDRVEI